MLSRGGSATLSGTGHSVCESKIVALAESITLLQAENLLLNAQNRGATERFKKLADYNRALGEEVTMMDRDIALRQQEIERNTAQLQQLEAEIRRIEKEILRIRRYLLKNKQFAGAARSFSRIQRERTELIDRVHQLRVDRSEGVDSVSALLTDKIQLLKEENSDLVRAISVLDEIGGPDASISARRRALEKLLRDMDKRIDALAQNRAKPRPAAPEAHLDGNFFHASELFGELSDGTEVDDVNIDEEPIKTEQQRLESERWSKNVWSARDSRRIAFGRHFGRKANAESRRRLRKSGSG
jgi:chromosome segregation ATPase